MHCMKPILGRTWWLASVVNSLLHSIYFYQKEWLFLGIVGIRESWRKTKSNKPSSIYGFIWHLGRKSEREPIKLEADNLLFSDSAFRILKLSGQKGKICYVTHLIAQNSHKEKKIGSYLTNYVESIGQGICNFKPFFRVNANFSHSTQYRIVTGGKKLRSWSQDLISSLG